MRCAVALFLSFPLENTLFPVFNFSIAAPTKKHNHTSDVTKIIPSTDLNK